MGTGKVYLRVSARRREAWGAGSRSRAEGRRRQHGRGAAPPHNFSTDAEHLAAHSYLTVIRRICAAPHLAGLRPNTSTALHVRQSSGILILARLLDTLAPGLRF